MMAMMGLWMATLAQDLERRVISLFVLAALAVLSLVGQEWPWWVAMSAIVLWPSRENASVLVPLVISAGFITGDLVPAAAMAAGAIAWGLGWWGGADGIALAALALREGLPGLIAGSLAMALMGIVLMITRGRSWTALFATAPDVFSLKARHRSENDLLIPNDAEMPAAAALAVAGLAMEVIRLWQMVM